MACWVAYRTDRTQGATTYIRANRAEVGTEIGNGTGKGHAVVRESRAGRGSRIPILMTVGEGHGGTEIEIETGIVTEMTIGIGGEMTRAIARNIMEGIHGEVHIVCRLLFLCLLFVPVQKS